MPREARVIVVAVVDNDEDFLASMRALLESSREFKCGGLYRDPRIALNEIPFAVPDVVLTEIQIQDMSAIEFTQRLKTLLPQLKIIIVSNCSERQVVLQALLARVSGYLVKPLRRRELLAAIHSVAAGGVALTATVQAELVDAFHSSNAILSNRLSAREREVLALIFQHRSDKEIAQALGI